MAKKAFPGFKKNERDKKRKKKVGKDEIFGEKKSPYVGNIP
jgi:hypothetical protein